MKVRSDRRSKFSNLNNWKEDAWKNQGFNGIQTRDLYDASAMLYRLSFEATHWEVNKMTTLPMSGFIAQLVEHRTGVAEVTGLNPVEALIFFRLLLSYCFNWKIYCDKIFTAIKFTATN